MEAGEKGVTEVASIPNDYLEHFVSSGVKTLHSYCDNCG
jgi:hypothetical protein